MQQHLVLVVFVVSKYWVGRKIISMYQENMYKGYTPMATMSFVPQYIHSFKCKSLQKLHNKFPQSSAVQLFQIVWLAGIDESSMYRDKLCIGFWGSMGVMHLIASTMCEIQY
jgi:hypothetical protein